jgi:putative NADPH-quinone reductase
MVIYAHPYDGSFNHALLEAALKGLKTGGHEVDLLDLNRDGFDPIMSAYDLNAARHEKPVDAKILEYQKRIENANHLVFIFPVWYADVPAILKGFLEKVFSKGWAYEPILHSDMSRGLLKHLTATVISTFGLSRIVYKILLHDAVWAVLIKAVLKFTGVRKIRWFKLNRVEKASKARHEKWLRQIESYMAKLK